MRLLIYTKSYNDLPVKGVYEIFDYEFLKNDKYSDSIEYYSKILQK